MTTALLRHASTSYSTQYWVNGDPTVTLPLSPDGEAACLGLRELCTLPQVRTWIASEFLRSRQTATLLGATSTALHLLPGLNELDYGCFEGGPFLDYAAWLQKQGPWARPDGASESQREGVARMLSGVRTALKHPRPSVIVGHGLLLSVLRWALSEPAGTPMPLFFPEAACLDPLILSDSQLEQLMARLPQDVGYERIT